MTRRSTGRATMLAPLAATFAAGIIAGWLLHARTPSQPREAPASLHAPDVEAAAPATRGFERPPGPADAAAMRAEPRPSAPPAAPALESRPLPMGPPTADKGVATVETLRRRHLRRPIDDVKFEALKGNFSEKRVGDGGHVHEAVDILAPRHTPIHAVDAGTIAKLFDSKAGGHTVYQFDPDERFAYYYAHLDRYAPGLREGQRIAEGDVIGYVGTSGNAPPNTPHLHFTIFELGPERHWWQGRPIDPYLVFRR